MVDDVAAARDASAEDEDAVLLWQATARAEKFLDDLASGRSTAADLRALLNYLREVVVARIAEEERYILPSLAGVDSADSESAGCARSTFSSARTSRT